MAAQEIYYFSEYELAKLKGEVTEDIATDDVAIALVIGVPSQTGHNFWDDLVGTEIAAATSYVAANTSGGKILTSVTLVISGTEVVFDADSVFWDYDASGATNAAAFVLFFKNVGNNAAARLIAFGEFDATQSLQNANGIGIAFPDNGIGRS